jgi:PAS domain S-box-containing protein
MIDERGAARAGGAPSRAPAGEARDPERLLEAALRTSLDGFLVVRAGRLVDANDAMSAISGYSRDELLRLGIADLEAMETPDDVRRHSAAIEAAGHGRFSSRHRRKDGRIIDVEVTVTTLPDLGVHVAFVRDVTEALAGRAELERRETLFRAMIERSTDMILLLDEEGRYRFWSPSAVEALGWTAEEAVGMTAFEIIHPEDAPKLVASFRSIEGRPDGVASLAARFRTKAGEWRLVEGTGRNLFHDPAVRAVVVNGRDTTDVRALEARGRQSQRLESLGRLAGGIAHDFNNLLTVMLSAAEVLREDVGGLVPSALADVDAVRTAGERARDLVRQLLAFASRQVITPAVLDPGEVARHAVALLRRVLGEDVVLDLQIAPGLWVIRADPGQLEQVLVNLGLNARDAMPGGGRLRIALDNLRLSAADAAQHAGWRAGDWVRLVVADEGPGFSAEARAHLFEPFYTTKPKGKGTGLGLATVWGIVSQAGGVVELETGPGPGARFVILLPRTLDAAEAAQPAGPVEVAAGTGTVLLVEDDPQVRDVAARALRAAGYAPIEASCGADALEVARSGAPLDLLVTDVIMPGMSGKELADAVAALRPGLPTLFVSGHAEDLIVKSGVVEPGLDLLPKPFTPSQLVARVQRVLGRE